MQIITDVSNPRASADVTRRALLQAVGLASACRLRALVAGFTSIADDLVWLMRWCCFGSCHGAAMRPG